MNLQEKINKIELGSAQFGLSYGLMNKFGQVTSEEVVRILEYAADIGINAIDTSGDYGNSEEVLGDILKTNGLEFRIFSKNATDNIENSFKESSERLGRVEGYYIHYFESFKNNPVIWKSMQELKGNGKVKQIGFSLYTPEELEYLIDNVSDMNVIQIPINMFDRRFVSYLPILNEKNISVHIRSAFFQGLFFKDADLIPSNLNCFREPLRSLKQYCDDNNVSIEALALDYVLSLEGVSNVIIGIHSYEQLEENIKSLNSAIPADAKDYIESIVINNTRMLNPSNWNK